MQRSSVTGNNNRDIQSGHPWNINTRFMNKTALYIFLCCAIGLFLPGCGHHKSTQNNSGTDTLNIAVMKEKWGSVDGNDVYLYTLKNKHGIVVKISTYGAIITSILTPDSKGVSADIVLGYDNLKSYLAGSPYFGAIVGRYANRIAKGTFRLNGKVYQLARNNGNNCLHGGIKGFDKVVWKAHEISSATGTGVVLTYQSRDGEEGFPGNLTVTVNYFLNHDNELKTEIQAFTDSG